MKHPVLFTLPVAFFRALFFLHLLPHDWPVFAQSFRMVNIAYF